MMQNLFQTGDFPLALNFDHFPNRLTAAVFRNWNLVPLERLAKVLHTTPDKLKELAALMGCPDYDGKQAEKFIHRSYISVVRQNWHIFNFEQLIEILDMTASKFNFCLKEDDFLWYKLGGLKPQVEPIYYKELTVCEIEKCKKISAILDQYFPKKLRSFKPFDFVSCAKAHPKHSEKLRMIYPYSAGYGDPLMNDDLSDFPESLFQDYQEAGVNGIWMQALLSNLVPYTQCPEFSGDYERRRRNLNRLTERAGKYGVGIYLYFNEPRTIPAGYADKFKEWGGLNWDGDLGLCTSKPAVLDYIYNSFKTLFTVCSGIAGIFTITRSENHTHCVSHDRQADCPLCSKRNKSDIISELLKAMADGICSVKPSARVMAYTWAWENEYIEELIHKLPKNVSVLTVSEWGVPTEVDGYKSFVVDYSISHPGPSEMAKRNWKAADQVGLNKIAKIQVNNSWEMSAVPYIPVFDLVEEHLKNIRQAGVDDFMLCWTLGGAPSPMIGLLDKSKEEIYLSLYGESVAGEVAEAVHNFSDGFRNFPFEKTSVIYNAPMNYGAMNLLYRSNTGYKASMVGMPYDDLKTWRSIYPEAVFAGAFKRICDKWQAGLNVLTMAEKKVDAEHAASFKELKNYAEAVYCHFKSTYNQIEYIMNRDDYDKKRSWIETLLKDEINLAVKTAELQNKDSKIGFEASNHYYYTPNALMEKVLNCENLLPL